MTNPSDSNGSDPLDAVVDDYLQPVETGTPTNRDALLAPHPELTDRLRETGNHRQPRSNDQNIDPCSCSFGGDLSCA